MPTASSDSAVIRSHWSHLCSSCNVCLCVTVVWTSCLLGVGEDPKKGMPVGLWPLWGGSTQRHLVTMPALQSTGLAVTWWTFSSKGLVSFTIIESDSTVESVYEVGLIVSAKISVIRTMGQKSLYFLQRGAKLIPVVYATLWQTWSLNLLYQIRPFHLPNNPNPPSSPASTGLYIWEGQGGIRETGGSFLEETCCGADPQCVSFWSPKGMEGACFPFLTFTQGRGFQRTTCREGVGGGKLPSNLIPPMLASSWVLWLPWALRGGWQSYWENSSGNWSLCVAEARPLYQSLDGMQLEAVGTWGQKGEKGLLLPVSWTSRVWWGRHLSFPEA